MSQIIEENPPLHHEYLHIEGIPSSDLIRAAGGCILTFGIFDGLLPGQQDIAQAIQKRGTELLLPSVVLLFRPRPIETRGATPYPYLSSQDETVNFLKAMGVTYVGVLSFTKELAEMAAEPFLTLLSTRLPMRELWLGPKAMIGNGTGGALSSAREICEKLGFELKVFTDSQDTKRKDTYLSLFDSKDLSQVHAYLKRNYVLPAYSSEATSFDTSVTIKCYSLLTPNLLYIPPDGSYVVRIHPATFGDLYPRSPTESGYGLLTIATSRISETRPRIQLLSSPHAQWQSMFVQVEFVQALQPSLSYLWQLASEYLGDYHALINDAGEKSTLLPAPIPPMAQIPVETRDVVNMFLKDGHTTTPQRVN